MFNRRIALWLACATLSACAANKPTAINGASTEVESADWWYATGKQKAAEQAQRSGYPARARNVIVFLGDGMSLNTLTAARILEGQLMGHSGEENLLTFEQFPQTALSKTYNTNQQTPDSAGTMSAIMTGMKTRAGVIAVKPEAEHGRCHGGRLHAQTLLELAENRGLRTGVVSTARLTHATPAATYAHAEHRGWENDTELPEEHTGCADIASQLIDFSHGDGIEVAMGGGRGHFLPGTQADPEYPDRTGWRGDGRDLMREWQDQYSNAQTVWNLRDFNAVDPARTDHLLGLFEPSHMQYEHDRPKDTGGEPSLAEMTRKALQILQRPNGGFFLMVEAGRIDHGHHAGNAYRALTDTIALSEAVQVALDSVDLNDTLIIVTADHAHTMTISGYAMRGNPILGKVRVGPSQGAPQEQYYRDAQNKPYTTLSYANGPGYVNGDQRPDLEHVDTTAPDYKQAATLPFSSETHGGEDVIIFANGAGSQAVRGVLEQHVIYHIMRQALGW